MQDLRINWKYVADFHLEETDNIEVRWSNFEDAVQSAADSIISPRQGTCKEQWILNESWTLIDER